MIILMLMLLSLKHLRNPNTLMILNYRECTWTYFKRFKCLSLYTKKKKADHASILLTISINSTPLKKVLCQRILEVVRNEHLNFATLIENITQNEKKKKKMYRLFQDM